LKNLFSLAHTFGRSILLVMGTLVGVAVSAYAATPRPVVTVAADGSGQFRTVQAAVNAASAAGLVIRIAPGTYKEKLTIAGDNIELRGEGKSPEDVVLTWDDSAGSAGGTGKSGSVNVTGNNFFAENLTMQNDWERTHARGQEGSQAVALYITGDREVLRHVRLLGYQDTLYSASTACHQPLDNGNPCAASRQLFDDCYIAGHVDFIFGDAKAVFDHCEIHGVAHETVMLTAQSRLFPQEDSGYLFRDCTITADPGVGTLVLGRPWRTYATVLFVNTTVRGAAIAPAGWQEWAGRLATSTYAEFNTHQPNGKPVDVSQRIAPSRQLTAAEAAKLTVQAWLAGPDGWNAEAVQ
jgi:pectinesterase